MHLDSNLAICGIVKNDLVVFVLVFHIIFIGIREGFGEAKAEGTEERSDEVRRGGDSASPLGSLPARLGLATASQPRLLARHLLRRSHCHLPSQRRLARTAAGQSFASRCGEGEIRTPETLASLPVFETGAFNRSATSPL